MEGKVHRKGEQQGKAGPSRECVPKKKRGGREGVIKGDRGD